MTNEKTINAITSEEQRALFLQLVVNTANNVHAEAKEQVALAKLADKPDNAVASAKALEASALVERTAARGDQKGGELPSDLYFEWVKQARARSAARRAKRAEVFNNANA